MKMEVTEEWQKIYNEKLHNLLCYKDDQIKENKMDRTCRDEKYT
jgi:hypothetical protein